MGNAEKKGYERNTGLVYLSHIGVNNSNSSSNSNNSSDNNTNKSSNSNNNGKMEKGVEVIEGAWEK